MSDSRFWKLVLVANGAVPLALLTWDELNGELGGNSVNIALHTTGSTSLIFLLITLAVTPIRRLTGWNLLIGLRRSLGLIAFFYACVHVGIYVVLDRSLDLASTINEITLRRYLQVGLAAFLLLVPLAVTSTNAMVRRLGARDWKRLHRLAYPATALVTLHYYMQVKADVSRPLIFAGILTALLASRGAWRLRDRRERNVAAKRRFWSGELSVARIVDETPDVRTFRLVSPEGGPLPFEFEPGQYANIQLSIDGRRVHRSYTIASSPTQRDYCELTIKRLDGGVASSYLHANLKPGDRLKIAAPAGRFVFHGTESDRVVLIGGGVGITPLMSIIRYLTDNAWSGRIWLLFVARSQRDIIFKEELESLGRQFPNLTVHIALTRLDNQSEWTGQRTRPDGQWLRTCVPELAHIPVYLCGPDAMMRDVRSMLLDLGVPEHGIKTESFVSPGAGRIEEAPIRNESSYSDTPIESIATFSKSGRTVGMRSEISLLEAAESIGVELPYECRAGVCGQCKVRVLSGSALMDVEDAISGSEKADGWILACQARPLTDITIDA
jgi:ferredoxin-NADP reductase/DMSO/TMAO reductase YedYZ heme-binding membrane subunit